MRTYLKNFDYNKGFWAKSFFTFVPDVCSMAKPKYLLKRIDLSQCQWDVLYRQAIIDLKGYKTSLYTDSQKKDYTPSLGDLLYLCVKPHVLRQIKEFFIYFLLTISLPFMIEYFLSFIEEKNPTPILGVLIFLSISFVLLIQVIWFQRLQYKSVIISVRVSLFIKAVIQDKVINTKFINNLELQADQNQQRKDFLLEIFQKDCEVVQQWIYNSHYILTVPIILAMVLLLSTVYFSYMVLTVIGLFIFFIIILICTDKYQKKIRFFIKFLNVKKMTKFQFALKNIASVKAQIWEELLIKQLIKLKIKESKNQIFIIIMEIFAQNVGLLLSSLAIFPGFLFHHLFIKGSLVVSTKHMISAFLLFEYVLIHFGVIRDKVTEMPNLLKRINKIEYLLTLDEVYVEENQLDLKEGQIILQVEKEETSIQELLVNQEQEDQNQDLVLVQDKNKNMNQPKKNQKIKNSLKNIQQKKQKSNKKVKKLKKKLDHHKSLDQKFGSKPERQVAEERPHQQQSLAKNQQDNQRNPVQDKDHSPQSQSQSYSISQLNEKSKQFLKQKTKIQTLTNLSKVLSDEIPYKEKFSLYDENSQLLTHQYNIPQGSQVNIISENRNHIDELTNIFLGEQTIKMDNFGDYCDPETGNLKVIKKGIKVSKNGEVNYLTKNPFILENTIKDNICFGQEYQTRWLNQVLKICDLEETVQYFTLDKIKVRPSQLDNEIKKKMAVARAVYQRKPIILIELYELSNPECDKFWQKIYQKVVEEYWFSKTKIWVCDRISMTIRKNIDVFLFITEDKKVYVHESYQSLRSNRKYREMKMRNFNITMKKLRLERCFFRGPKQQGSVLKSGEYVLNGQQQNYEQIQADDISASNYKFEDIQKIEQEEHDYFIEQIKLENQNRQQNNDQEGQGIKKQFLISEQKINYSKNQNNEVINEEEEEYSQENSLKFIEIKNKNQKYPANPAMKGSRPSSNKQIFNSQQQIQMKNKQFITQKTDPVTRDTYSRSPFCAIKQSQNNDFEIDQTQIDKKGKQFDQNQGQKHDQNQDQGQYLQSQKASLNQIDSESPSPVFREKKQESLPMLNLQKLESKDSSSKTNKLIDLKNGRSGISIISLDQQNKKDQENLQDQQDTDRRPLISELSEQNDEDKVCAQINKYSQQQPNSNSKTMNFVPKKVQVDLKNDQKEEKELETPEKILAPLEQFIQTKIDQALIEKKMNKTSNVINQIVNIQASIGNTINKTLIQQLKDRDRFRDKKIRNKIESQINKYSKNQNSRHKEQLASKFKEQDIKSIVHLSVMKKTSFFEALIKQAGNPAPQIEQNIINNIKNVASRQDVALQQNNDQLQQQQQIQQKKKIPKAVDQITNIMNALKPKNDHSGNDEYNNLKEKDSTLKNKMALNIENIKITKNVEQHNDLDNLESELNLMKISNQEIQQKKDLQNIFNEEAQNQLIEKKQNFVPFNKQNLIDLSKGGKYLDKEEEEKFEQVIQQMEKQEKKQRVTTFKNIEMYFVNGSSLLLLTIILLIIALPNLVTFGLFVVFKYPENNFKFDQIVFYFYLFGASILVFLTFSAFQAIASSCWIQSISVKIYHKLVVKKIKLKLLESIQEINKGVDLMMIIKYVNKLELALCKNLAFSIWNVVHTFTAISVITIMIPYMIIPIPFMFFIFLMRRKQVIDATMKLDILHNELAQETNQVLVNLAEGQQHMRCNSSQTYFISKNQLSLEQGIVANYESLICNLWVNLQVQILNVCLFSIFILVILVNKLEGNKPYDSFYLPFTLMYCLYFMNNFNHRSDTWSAFTQDLEHINELKLHIDFSKQDIQNRNLLLTDQQDQQLRGGLIAKNLNGQGSLGKIEFRHVKLKFHKNGSSVLKGISFKLPNSCKTCIIKSPKAGATTLFNSILKNYDIDAGKILIDGQNIYNMNLDELRSSINFIASDPYMIEGTVRSNIDPFNTFQESYLLSVLQKDILIWQRVFQYGMGDKEAVQQLKKSCQNDDSFLQKQKSFQRNNQAQSLRNLDNQAQGERSLLNFQLMQPVDMLNVVVLENGNNLTKKQKFFVSLLGSILKTCKIMLIDELSGDGFTDQEFKDVMFLLRKRTKYTSVLWVIDDYERAREFDQAIIMDKGKVIEYGSVQEKQQDRSSIMCELLNPDCYYDGRSEDFQIDVYGQIIQRKFKEK